MKKIKVNCATLLVVILSLMLIVTLASCAAVDNGSNASDGSSSTTDNDNPNIGGSDTTTGDGNTTLGDGATASDDDTVTTDDGTNDTVTTDDGTNDTVTTDDGTNDTVTTDDGDTQTTEETTILDLGSYDGGNAVTYDNQGGVGYTSSGIIEHCATYEGLPTKVGYTFVGYFNDEDEEAVIDGDGVVQGFLNEGDVLHARWK